MSVTGEFRKLRGPPLAVPIKGYSILGVPIFNGSTRVADNDTMFGTFMATSCKNIVGGAELPWLS